MEDLLEHARGEFLLDQKQKDGSSLRDTLLSVQRQTRVRPRELDVLPCPPEVEYILEWFYELHWERNEDALGRPMAFTSEKLDAWSRLQRISPTAFELDVLKRLDRLFISKKFDRKEEEPQCPPTSQPLG